MAAARQNGRSRRGLRAPHRPLAAQPQEEKATHDDNPKTIIADLRKEYEAAGSDDERKAVIEDWRAKADGYHASIRELTGAEPLPGETWEQKDPPAREWLICDMLPAGRLAALYGEGGPGKSTLALQLAAAVMHGGAPLPAHKPDAGKAEDLIARHPVLQPIPEDRTGKVLWLTWEGEIAEVIRRWRMAHHACAIDTPFPDPKRLTLVDVRKIGGPLWGPERGFHVSTAATWTDRRQALPAHARRSQAGDHRPAGGGLRKLRNRPGAQPVLGCATAPTSERIRSVCPARTCPRASAIITASVSPTQVLIFARPRMQQVSKLKPLSRRLP